MIIDEVAHWQGVSEPEFGPSSDSELLFPDVSFLLFDLRHLSRGDSTIEKSHRISHKYWRNS